MRYERTKSGKKFFTTTVRYYMISLMCNELQRKHEDMEPRAMLLPLVKLFASKVGDMRKIMVENSQ